MFSQSNIVQKKSKKPFQNKSKVAIIESFDVMEVPYSNSNKKMAGKTKVIACCYLIGCKGCMPLDKIELAGEETI